MSIYYVTLFLIAIFAYIAQYYLLTKCPIEGKDQWQTKNTAVWLVAIPLVFFAGFRYQVGSDWYYYFSWTHKQFSHYLSQSFSEPGWKIIGYIATLVVDRYGSAMFLAALITILLYIRTIAKYSTNFTFSVILYFFLTWHGCFNGVRQYLAAAMLFAGHRFVYERKFWKWLLVVAIASLFHTTAFVMVFWYFVATRKLNTKQVFLLVIIGIVAFLSYDRIFDLLSFLKGKTVDPESLYASNDVNLLRIAVKWAPVIFLAFLNMNSKSKQYDSEYNFYSNMILLNAIFMTVSMRSAYLARVGIYTDCFTLLAWPLMLKKLNRKSKQIMTVILLFCYGGYWLYDITSHAELRNFQLLFGKL